MFKAITTAIVLLASVQSFAGSYYIVNGKVMNAGQAQKAGQDSKSIVYKIQASRVALNSETGRLKKSADVPMDELKKQVAAAK